MVEACGELNDLGCFGLEMRRQAYPDRRYIRADWLTVDPPTGTVAIGTPLQTESPTWGRRLPLSRGHCASCTRLCRSLPKSYGSD